MPACGPVYEIALCFFSLIAIARSAMEICSPVDNSMSISLSSGLFVISAAFSIKSSVISPGADTTTTIFLARFLFWMIRFAAFNNFSALDTLDPPNFITIKSIIALILENAFLFVKFETTAEPDFLQVPLHQRKNSAHHRPGRINFAGSAFVGFDQKRASEPYFAAISAPFAVAVPGMSVLFLQVLPS